MNPATEVEAIEIRLLLEAIHARYGYDLRGYSQGSMRRRVLAALARSGLKDLGSLQHRLLHDASFFAGVLEDLTVRVSEMFRDPGFYTALRTLVIPVLRTYPLIRIWHAGCASGEEVYGTAILLTEAGLYDRAQIYATDLSPQALDHARSGVYAAEQLARFRQGYQEAGGTGDFGAHCTAAYDGVAMNDSLRRNILFFQHDLVGDEVFGEMQVVFCRNVLIYFGTELRRKVVAKLGQSLIPGGFLCLGASETLAPESELGFTAFAGEGRIYRHEP